MGQFKALGQTQRVLAAQDQINAIFCPRHHRFCAVSSRDAGADAFNLWHGHAAEMTA